MKRPLRDLASFALQVDEGFSGVVYARFHGEECVVARGPAHRETRTLIRRSTRFGIASGTKGFTAITVLRSIDSGAIDFDSRVGELLPGVFPRFAPDVTVRHLLTHTSGIPDYCDEEAGCDFEALWAERPVYTMRTPADFVPLFADRPMQFDSGARFSYSNSGFIVLGLILEAVHRRSYAECVRDAVFAPAGMEASGFFASDALPPDTAVGYIENSDATFRSNVFAIPVVGGPDGGAYTCVDDLVRFWRATFDGTLLRKPTAAAMRATKIGPTCEDLEYSLGFWRTDAWGSETWFVLLGSDPGVSFASGYCPASGDLFAILSNTGDGAWGVLRELRATIAPC